MENVTRNADMDQNVMNEVEGGLENGQNVDFVVNETEDIPPAERTILDQIWEIILSTEDYATGNREDFEKGIGALE